MLGWCHVTRSPRNMTSSWSGAACIATGSRWAHHRVMLGLALHLFRLHTSRSDCCSTVTQWDLGLFWDLHLRHQIPCVPHEKCELLSHQRCEACIEALRRSKEHQHCISASVRGSIVPCGIIVPYGIIVPWYHRTVWDHGTMCDQAAGVSKAVEMRREGKDMSLHADQAHSFRLGSVELHMWGTLAP